MTAPVLPASLLVAWLPLALLGFPFGPGLDRDATPRTTVLFDRLLRCNRLPASAAVGYSSLLLEEDILYVGAREALYAVDAHNVSSVSRSRMIDWPASADQRRLCLNKGRNNQTECYNHVRFLQRLNETHLYACGTNAFRPLCSYIDVERFALSRSEDGRERCPYDPAKPYTALLVDGDMFSATQYEFRSTSDIRRNFPFPVLKTEEAPTRWLVEAEFVGSALLRESANSSVGDDDKIYFFFTEKNQEQAPYSTHTRVARVARVCKGDIGGQRTLQKKWTSFLKARLLCSVPDYGLQFNVLRSVAVLHAPSVHDSVLYGVFSLEWKSVKVSAMCKYTLSDIQRAFEGPYMENQDSRWREYTGKVPEPRPGSCITDEHRSQQINSSRDLPDSVLAFARRHPLMATQIQPAGGRPLAVKKSTDYTRLGVLPVVALDGKTYTVLFMTTDEGWLHRAVEVEERLHIIEELQLFKEPQEIYSMVVSPQQRSVYLSAQTGVVQVPLSACERYTSCWDCVFARDPFCGWDGRVCVEARQRSGRSNLIQDVQTGNRGCEKSSGDAHVAHRTRSVTAGNDILLRCELRSNLATPRWTLNGRDLQGYGLDSGYRVGTDGLLVIGARVRQSGQYRCFALENGVQVPLRRYTVSVRASAPDSPSAAPPSEDPAERPLPSPPVPLPVGPEFHSYRHMEALYMSLVAVLGGLCLVLTVVLLYVSFCARHARHSRKFSQQGLWVTAAAERKRSSLLELNTVSSHCNGRMDGLPARERQTVVREESSFLQLVPGDGQSTRSKDAPPPAPPLPMPPPLPDAEYANGLSAALPNMLRKMNGNSYVLLGQPEAETTSPLCHSFAEELNRILEKRKHTSLDPEPDESSV
ncbi:semaphorin-4G isoform X2 [Denticeps clupeoides]|uniref:Semaphorin-4G n=1 Tax=Denticeps clupeoides TaxID=299321 RepID=A0AAY4AIX5_9TELE|nr:semaphorin-4G isoform X2 [Denticeps clupeoides]